MDSERRIQEEWGSEQNQSWSRSKNKRDPRSKSRRDLIGMGQEPIAFGSKGA